MYQTYKTTHSQHAMGQLFTCIDLEECRIKTTMFEKYPSISPYTYCANNPVKYVDPDGKILRMYGVEANETFKSLLMSFSGVTNKNMMKAFGLKHLNGYKNAYGIKGRYMSQDQFAENYKKHTKMDISGKDLDNAYSIYTIASKPEQFEIGIFELPKKCSPSFGEDNKIIGGTIVVDKIPGFERTNNINEDFISLMQKIDKGEGINDEFNKKAGEEGIAWPYDSGKGTSLFVRTVMIHKDRAGDGDNMLKILQEVVNDIDY